MIAPIIRREAESRGLSASSEQALVHEVCVVLASIDSGDWRPYFNHRVERGDVPDRPAMAATANQWAAWSLMNPVRADRLADDQLFEYCWEGDRRSGMSCRVHPDRVIATIDGRFRAGGGEWPYAGMRSHVSVFSRSIAAESREPGSRAMVVVPITLSDGQSGHVAVEFVRADGEWAPTVMHVGSSSPDVWPWPFF